MFRQLSYGQANTIKKSQQKVIKTHLMGQIEQKQSFEPLGECQDFYKTTNQFFGQRTNLSNTIDRSGHKSRENLRQLKNIQDLWSQSLKKELGEENLQEEVRSRVVNNFTKKRFPVETMKPTTDRGRNQTPLLRKSPLNANIFTEEAPEEMTEGKANQEAFKRYLKQIQEQAI